MTQIPIEPEIVKAFTKESSNKIIIIIIITVIIIFIKIAIKNKKPFIITNLFIATK